MVYIYYTVSEYWLTGCIFPWLDITLNYIALHVWLKNLPASIDITVPSIMTCNAEGDPGVIWEQHKHINWIIDLTVMN